LQDALYSRLLPAIPMLLQAGGLIDAELDFDELHRYSSPTWQHLDIDSFYEVSDEEDMDKARLIYSHLLLRYPQPNVGEVAAEMRQEAREWLARYQTDCPIQQRFIEDMRAIPLLPEPWDL
jgi:hypothetical protein